MLIVSFVIVLCVAYAVRRVYMVMRKPERGCGNCGSCHGSCPGCQ